MCSQRAVALSALSVALAFTFVHGVASADLPRMTEDSPFNADVSAAAVHPDSADITSWLENEGGWGFGGLFRIDFTTDVVEAADDDPTIALTKAPGYYDDCDEAGVIPLPPGGTVQGHPDYQCTGGGDCYLIVHDAENALLYEAFQADVTNDVFEAVCLAEWKLEASYPPSGRGEGCASADAAGFPIAPLLFDADEINAGSIDHAIRFMLPNDRMRAGQYLHPASHYGAPTAPSDSDAPIYGMRLRLESSFDTASYSPAARVILAALKKYGMFLADGGQIPLTARSDRGTVTKWADLDLGPTDIQDLQPSDFEVLDGWGPDPHRGPYEGWPDCVKNTIPEPADGLLAATATVALATLARRRR